MAKLDTLAQRSEDALNRYILGVTIPLFADADSDRPLVLGTGTLFEHEGRRFIVTANHALKADQDNLNSDDIDFSRIAVPLGLTKAPTHSLGRLHVYRPTESNVDVAVIEVLEKEVIAELDRQWRTIGLSQIAPYPAEGALIVNGYLHEGSSAKDGNISQKFFSLGTVPLDHTPDLPDLNPELDRFLLLQRKGELANGQTDHVPSLKGMSGTSVWTINQTGELWDPSLALKVVAVQTAARAGHYVRCTDWSAVMAVFKSPEVGFQSLP